MNILVTGCAGFIGSVVTERLVDKGYNVIGVDNLQSSYREAVNPNIKFWQIDIGDNWLDTVMYNEKIDCVFHLAAESIIGISYTQPEKFFLDNVVKGYKLLESMRRTNVKQIVLSSTASTYGEPLYIPMDENHPQNPINSYGRSKLMFEQMLEWYVKAHDFKYTMFRYYNVGGATKNNGERRKEETRLIPTILRCSQSLSPLNIFGNDYPTKDGTCIRDYVHVIDVADAHILALADMTNEVYNLGSGEGYTVLEILKKMEDVIGYKVNYRFVERRKGDPVSLVASNEKAIKQLGWNPVNSTLERVCLDSYNWHKKL